MEAMMNSGTLVPPSGPASSAAAPTSTRSSRRNAAPAQAATAAATVIVPASPPATAASESQDDKEKRKAEKKRLKEEKKLEKAMMKARKGLQGAAGEDDEEDEADDEQAPEAVFEGGETVGDASGKKRKAAAVEPEPADASVAANPAVSEVNKKAKGRGKGKGKDKESAPADQIQAAPIPVAQILGMSHPSIPTDGAMDDDKLQQLANAVIGGGNRSSSSAGQDPADQSSNALDQAQLDIAQRVQGFDESTIDPALQELAAIEAADADAATLWHANRKAVRAAEEAAAANATAARRNKGKGRAGPDASAAAAAAALDEPADQFGLDGENDNEAGGYGGHGGAYADDPFGHAQTEGSMTDILTRALQAHENPLSMAGDLGMGDGVDYGHGHGHDSSSFDYLSGSGAGAGADMHGNGHSGQGGVEADGQAASTSAGASASHAQAQAQTPAQLAAAAKLEAARARRRQKRNPKADPNEPVRMGRPPNPVGPDGVPVPTLTPGGVGAAGREDVGAVHPTLGKRVGSLDPNPDADPTGFAGRGRRQGPANAQAPKGPKDHELIAQFQTLGEMERFLADRWLPSQELIRLEQAGILAYKKGKFSIDESEAIRNYAEEFKRINNIDSHQFAEMVVALGKKELYPRFWNDLAAVVPGRPVRFVQKYVKRVFDPRARQGPWQQDEDKALEQACFANPGQWTKISAAVGRTEDDCRTRWRDELRHKADREKGRWTKEEEQRLEDIIVRHNIELGKEATARDAPWEAVVKEMGGSRTSMQCRKKWHDQLMPALKKAGGKYVLKKKDRPRLIDAIAAKDYAREEHVDFQEIARETFGLEDYHPVRAMYRRIRAKVPDADEPGLMYSALVARMSYALEQPQNQGAASGSGSGTGAIGAAGAGGHGRTLSGAGSQQYKSAARVEGVSDDEEEEEVEMAAEAGAGDRVAEGSGEGGVDTIATAAAAAAAAAAASAEAEVGEGGNGREVVFDVKH